MFYEVGSLCVGLLFLVYGSDWTVSSATAFAQLFGVSTLFVGVTIVAIGSSIPEIAIGVSSMYHDEQSVAVGTLLGSNITDPLFSLGIGAAVGTIVLDDPAVAVLGTAYMLAASAAVVLLAYRRRSFGRYEGAACVVLYVPTFLLG